MRVRKVSVFGLPLLLAVVVLLVPLMGSAQGDGFYTVSQGETQVPIVPLGESRGSGRVLQDDEHAGGDGL